MSPDERYLEDQECWPHSGPTVGRVEYSPDYISDKARRAPVDEPVTAIPLVDGGRAYEPQIARPEPSDEQQRAEAMQALSRLATHLRQSIDAQQRALADIGDILELTR